MARLRDALASLWSRRRWAYGIYMLVAVARDPARTGFRVSGPRCDLRLSLENAQLSLTKVPHIVLFGIFFLVTVVQFDRIDGRALAWSVMATLAMGLLVEIEEGATRTGNCRLTDVLPDLCGALIATVLLVAMHAIRDRLGDRTGAADHSRTP